jgi:hypothetical protein
VQLERDRVTMNIQNDAALPEITRYLVEQGLDVYAISPNRLSLEEVFLETVGKDGGL